MTINYTTLCMDNAIEVTWIYEELAREEKILSVKDVSNSDFIKEIIIGIATDFEKEYGNGKIDYIENDYLDLLRKFAEPILIDYFGK